MRVVFKVWTHRMSASAGLITFLVVLLWPSITLRSLDVWLATLADLFPTNVLYPPFAFLTGTLVAIYIYNKNVATCCPVGSMKEGASATAFGALLGACPACIPALAFFLPLSTTVFLSRISSIFLLLGIGVMLYSIYKMNGFREM